MRRERTSRIAPGCKLLLAMWVIILWQWLGMTGAQAEDSFRRYELSLAEALDRALQVNEDVAIARARLQQSEGERGVTRSELLPQLSLTMAYTRTLRSPFDGTDLAEEGVVTDERLFEAFGVGRENQYSLGAQLSQLLFDGGASLAGLRAAEARTQSAIIGVTAARAQTLLSAIQSYFDAVLAERLVEIAERSLEQASTVLEQTELAYRAGNRSEFDVLRARVARANQEPALRNRRNDRNRTLLQLQQLLDLPTDVPLELTTPVENLPVRFAVASDELPATRAPVRQAQQAVIVSEARLQQAARQRYPAIRLTSRYAPSALTSSGLPDANDVEVDWTAGVSVSVPLYLGGQLQANEAAARGALRQARAEWEQAYEAAELDARTSRDALAAARDTFVSSGATARQAQRAYDIAVLRYRNGLTTLVELLDTRLARDEALVTRAQAARDVQVARARLALLADLPLSSAGALRTPTAREAARPPLLPPTSIDDRSVGGNPLSDAVVGRP